MNRIWRSRNIKPHVHKSVEMQPLLENESEVRRQQESRSTTTNRGAGSEGARVDIAPLDSRCTRLFSGITLVFILFVYFWLISFQLIMAVQKEETWKICVLSLSLALQVSALKSSYFLSKLNSIFWFLFSLKIKHTTLLVISHLTYSEKSLLRKTFLYLYFQLITLCTGAVLDYLPRKKVNLILINIGFTLSLIVTFVNVSHAQESSRYWNHLATSMLDIFSAMYVEL